MKTKSKYSPFNRYFLIKDTTNNLYWERNFHYGFNYQNKAVFETRFLEDIQEAVALTWDEALEVLEEFKLPHIAGGRWKADTTSLIIERRPEFVSEEDMKLLRGEPEPLKITIPITIEEDDDGKPV